jgi:hypothetical protein
MSWNNGKTKDYISFFGWFYVFLTRVCLLLSIMYLLIRFLNI